MDMSLHDWLSTNQALNGIKGSFGFILATVIAGSQKLEVLKTYFQSFGVPGHT